MKNLLYKELRLAATPSLYIFTLMGAMVLIPAYPYSVVLFMGCLISFIIIASGRETRDIYYTVLLPIKKADAVKGKCLVFVYYQLLQLLFSVPFAVLRAFVLPESNPVGLDANITYYGLGLIIFALFNFIFLTMYYRTAYKTGKAFFVSMTAVVMASVAMEAISYIPALQWMDSIKPVDLLLQLPILLVGIVVYITGIIFTYRIAARRFEQVDL